MCPRPFGRGRLRPAGLFMPRARPCGRARPCSAPTTLRACATLFRAHDPAGVRDLVPRPRPCGRARPCSARTTLRACATLFRAHDPICRARDLSGSRDSGAGDGPWCGAWCAASASDLRHASIIFPRAYPRDAVRERAEHGRCDGRGLIGRAAAGRNRGRPDRSDRGRRYHGRDRGARPFAGR